MHTVAELLAHALYFSGRRVGLAEQRLDHVRHQVVAAGVVVAALRFRVPCVAAHDLERLGERVEGGTYIARDRDCMGSVVGAGCDLGQGRKESGQVWAASSGGLGGR